MEQKNYQVLPGPESYLPPAAASQGVVLPEKGEGLIEGRICGEEETMVAIAKKLLNAKNPTFFPGPLILWAWKDGVIEKAELLKELADVVDAKIIPMPDYRPKYPKINPEEEINPNHPNLTIGHNKIDACIFIGVHCHYANMGLKLIRGGTNCYTMALCGEYGHEDANITLRDVNLDTMRELIKVTKEEKKKIELREGGNANG